MLAKKFRLKKRDKIDYILKNDYTQKTSLFIAKTRINQLTHPRYCLIISKKFKLNSVKRNRLRRHFYTTIQTNLRDSKTYKSMDYALILKKEALEASTNEIKLTIDKLNL